MKNFSFDFKISGITYSIKLFWHKILKRNSCVSRGRLPVKKFLLFLSSKKKSFSTKSLEFILSIGVVKTVFKFVELINRVH